MVKQVSVCVGAHIETSARFEQSQILTHSPTVFECNLEKSLYLAALSGVRIILKNLSALRATRVKKSLTNFLSKHEAFSPLLARLTKNYWLTLTSEEKLHRANIRQQTLALKREQELLDGISVRKKIAKKFLKAHQRKMPIRLSQVELAWLDGNPECGALVSVKSKFLTPTSNESFDFSDGAYARLAARLRFEMLTPSDLNALKAHGVPILPDHTLSLDDAAWAREPYTKAVLYRLVTYRKNEQEAQSKGGKSASAWKGKSFKRIYLSTENALPKPLTTHFNQSPIVACAPQTHSPTVQATQPKPAQSLRRIKLERDHASCEILNRHEVSKRRWIEEVKEKVRSLFGFTTKIRPLVG